MDKKEVSADICTKSQTTIDSNKQKESQYIYQKYNEWENKRIFAQKNEHKISDLYLRIYREVYSDGKDVVLIYVKWKRTRSHECYFHFDSSVLYIKTIKTIYEVGNAIRNKVDYGKEEEWGYFEIDKKILLDICLSEEISFRIKSYREDCLKCCIRSESNFVEQARVFYNIVYDNAAFSNVIVAVEKRKEENLRKQKDQEKRKIKKQQRLEERRKRDEERKQESKENSVRKQENKGCVWAVFEVVGVIYIMMLMAQSV